MPSLTVVPPLWTLVPLNTNKPAPALVRPPFESVPMNSVHFVTGWLTVMVRIAPPRSTSLSKVSVPVRVVSSPKLA